MKNKKKYEPVFEKMRDKYSPCIYKNCWHFDYDLYVKNPRCSCDINRNPSTCKKVEKINKVLDMI